MISTTTYGAHGFTFRIASSDGDIVAVFDDLLVDMRVDHDAADHRIQIDPHHPTGSTLSMVRVQFDDERIHESLVVGSVVSHVLMEVNRRVATTLWQDRVVPLHASTAAGPDGAVIVAGASHSGKTTLATALAVSDGSFDVLLADEVSVLQLTTDPQVAPYGKPVALRPPGIDLLAAKIARLRQPGSPFEQDERFVPPSELGSQKAGSVPAAAIVFPRFDASGAPGSAPQLITVSPADALTRLMRLTLRNEPADTDTFRALERLAREAAAYDVVYSNALEAADHLGRAITGRSTT